MDFLSGSPFDGFGSAVIASGGVNTGVSHDLRNCGNIDSPIEHFTREGAPKVVRRKLFDLGLLGAVLEHVVYCLGGHRLDDNSPTFVDRCKDRPWRSAPDGKPIV